jgi:hypothetical protein
MSSEFFTELRSRTFEIHADALAKLKANKPKATRHNMVHHLQSGMMQWSLTQEELIANVSLKIDLLIRSIPQHTTSDERKGCEGGGIQVLTKQLFNLCNEYYSRRDDIEGKLEKTRNAK